MPEPRRGSGDRRRTTVSGLLPNLDDGDDDDGDDVQNPSGPSRDSMKFSGSSPSAPSSPVEQQTTAAASPAKRTEHRRSVSTHLLAKLNFLNRLSDDDRPPSREKEISEVKPPKSPRSSKSRKSIDDDEPVTSPVSPVKGDGAMAAVLKATKSRKRKGSLRKTALLGTRRLVAETRERRNSVLQRTPSLKQAQQVQVARTDDYGGELKRPPLPPRESSSTTLRKKFSYENVNAASSNDRVWPEPAAVTTARLSLLTDHRSQLEQRKSVTELKSPLDLKSSVSNASYASTTDDDDLLTFGRLANSYIAQQKPLSSTASSYFPEAPISRRLSHQSRKHSRSPLSQNLTSALSTFPASPLALEPHDYTETEYWGWVILVVTWLIFTVGMGSCLEIWSWAWDVGETPYAPPELEDDPTLPIVGYYPALIVLTGVVAWAWITVAWVGMKYFRHAKIEV